MSLANTTLGTSSSTIFTCSNADGCAVKSITLTNYGLVACTVTLYACPGGEAADNENIILKDLRLDPAESFNYKEANLLLANGDNLKGKASSILSIAVTTSFYNI